MIDARRLVIAVGAVTGAIATCGCAILFARYATTILLGSSRTGVIAITMVLCGSLRRKMARKRRLLTGR